MTASRDLRYVGSGRPDVRHGSNVVSKAVVDRLDLRTFDLMAAADSGPVAIALAARHPQRVSYLILWCCEVPGSDWLTAEASPQGTWIVVETDDVDAWYRRVLEKGLPVKEPLTDQKWGHRSFRLVDPDGIELFVFSKTG